MGFVLVPLEHTNLRQPTALAVRLPAPLATVELQPTASLAQTNSLRTTVPALAPQASTVPL